MTDPIVVDLEVSTVSLHKHGQNCLLHERETVKEGREMCHQKQFACKMIIR